MLLYQVDAFTSTPFSGNPAAVCVLSAPRDASWMQNVAGEMNLSETAFLRRTSTGHYRLRWFTPTDEVDLCGHATLAAAHVLWTEGFLADDEPARFDTKSGPLTATRQEDWIHMDFPADPVTPAEPPASLLDGLNDVAADAVGRSDRDYLVRLPTPEAVRDLEPHMNTLASLPARGVIVTAESPGSEVDFVSRFFAPGVGVPEDPVTGSAHCALGPYWAAHTGRTSLRGRQLSTRGGTVRLQLDTPEADRVTLAGQATTVLRGRLEA